MQMQLFMMRGSRLIFVIGEIYLICCITVPVSYTHLRDGLLFNPGPWGKHCLTAAHCAEKIASACGDMDVEKAYILGLLHDIGRKRCV